jgi:hypothetical protein
LEVNADADIYIDTAVLSLLVLSEEEVGNGTFACRKAAEALGLLFLLLRPPRMLLEIAERIEIIVVGCCGGCCVVSYLWFSGPMRLTKVVGYLTTNLCFVTDN